MTAEGAAWADIEAALVTTGVPVEEARLLRRALEQALEPRLEVNLSLSTHSLAPRSFSLQELGLSGPARWVGLYWVVFGALCVAAMGLFHLLWETEVVDAPSRLTVVVSRLAAASGVAAMGFGAYKLLTSLRLKRRVSEAPRNGNDPAP